MPTAEREVLAEFSADQCAEWVAFLQRRLVVLDDVLAVLHERGVPRFEILVGRLEPARDELARQLVELETLLREYAAESAEAVTLPADDARSRECGCPDLYCKHIQIRCLIPGCPGARAGRRHYHDKPPEASA